MAQLKPSVMWRPVLVSLGRELDDWSLRNLVPNPEFLAQMDHAYWMLVYSNDCSKTFQAFANRASADGGNS